MRKSVILYTMSALFLLIEGALADESAGTIRSWSIERSSSPITIDGQLNEAAWKAVRWTPVFGDIVTGRAPLYATKAKILWDDHYLYLGFMIEDANVWARNGVRDTPMCKQATGMLTGIAGNSIESGFGEYDENFIKIYIDPDGDARNYIEMHVSPIGNVCDKWQAAPNRSEGSVPRIVET